MRHAETDSDIAIRVTALSKSFAGKYGKKGESRISVLEDVSFEVPAGSIVAFLGYNGAGKTTLVRILSTLIVKDSGTVRVFGLDLDSEVDAVRGVLATTGQYAAVDENLTGAENLAFFGRLRGLSRAASLSRAAELLEEFGLADAADRTVATYSGGMRRRLDIAISLVVVPRLLFLDEPTTGLDPVSRKQLWKLVHSLRERGMTVVLTTQYLEEAEELADSIYLLNNHRVVAHGTPTELRRSVGGDIAEVEFSSDEEAATFAAALLGAEAASGRAVRFAVADQHAALAAIGGALERTGLTAASLSVAPPTLDDVFFRLGVTPGEEVDTQ